VTTDLKIPDLANACVIDMSGDWRY